MLENSRNSQEILRIFILSLVTLFVAEKIFQIDDHVAVGIAGITSDANALIEQLRLAGEFDIFAGLDPANFTLHGNSFRTPLTHNPPS